MIYVMSDEQKENSKKFYWHC